jgi:aspartate racemase
MKRYYRFEVLGGTHDRQRTRGTKGCQRAVRRRRRRLSQHAVRQGAVLRHLALLLGSLFGKTQASHSSKSRLKLYEQQQSSEDGLHGRILVFTSFPSKTPRAVPIVAPESEPPVKILGMIGGIAPGSTVDYYQLCIASYREQTHDGSYPPILINSIDLTRMLALVAENRFTELTEYLRDEVERLAQGGADFGLLASNTPHIVFEELSRLCSIPLLSIVEATCTATQHLGLKTVGLLGTRFTMEGGFYPKVFTRCGIAVRTPPPDDMAYVHDRYMGELVHGDFKAETRQGVMAVIERLMREGAEGVVLAGTELPLLLRGERDCGVPLLDTASIHVRRAVAEILS